MDKNLFYCDYKTCLLLKQKGFNEMCDAFYGDAFLYNGKYISPDHEYEYRIEGKEVVIEHGGWVYSMNNKNHDSYMNDKSCSLIAHPVAVKWLFEKTNIFISVRPYAVKNGFSYECDLLELKNNGNSRDVVLVKNKSGFEKPEDAYEFGIVECTKLIK